MKNGYLSLALLIFSTSFAFAETGPSQSQAAELAQQTLAKQNNLPVKNIEIDSATAVQWPDSSLGCPEPGMMYAQMITPGYRVTLRDSATGNVHFVHVGAGRAVVCDKN